MTDETSSSNRQEDDGRGWRRPGRGRGRTCAAARSGGGARRRRRSSVEIAGIGPAGEDDRLLEVACAATCASADGRLVEERVVRLVEVELVLEQRAARPGASALRAARCRTSRRRR